MISDEEYKNGSKKGAGGCSTGVYRYGRRKGYEPMPPKVGGTHPAASQNKSAAVGWAGGFDCCRGSLFLVDDRVVIVACRVPCVSFFSN